METIKEQRTKKLKECVGCKIVDSGEDWIQLDTGEKLYLSKKYIL